MRLTSMPTRLPPGLLRRRLLLATGLAGLVSAGTTQALPARALQFPRDLGAHNAFRTEWWYITGHVMAGQRAFGFQLTFFRSRIAATQAMESEFAAKQLIFAHAAITDVDGKQLWHDQRIARAGFEIASASEQDTAIKLRDWSLQRQAGRYVARLPAADFALDLELIETQPLLLQGQQGLSRKGPEPKQASYYYSLPQLDVSGSLSLKQQKFAVRGKAWLDHEWSDELLHPEATGWDWIGMNLLDGSALTAFQLRDKQGQALWDGGSFRSPKAGLYTFSRGEVLFKPVRRWKSPLSQASYPVEWLVRTPTDIYTVRALIDNQELDSRSSTGAIYWEGLSELIDSNGKLVGRGYLEMTGYASPLRL